MVWCLVNRGDSFTRISTHVAIPLTCVRGRTLAVLWLTTFFFVFERSRLPLPVTSPTFLTDGVMRFFTVPAGVSWVRILQ